MLAESVGAQLVNPIDDPLPSGLHVVLEPWLTIPLSPEDNTSPKLRINHLKPCPGGTRLFCNNLNGRLWMIPGTTTSTAFDFLNLAAFYPNFIRVTGLGTGFTSFDFHPEFATPGAPGYGKFYTAHSESSAGGSVDFSGPLSAVTSQIGTVVEWTMANHEDPAITPANHTRRTLLRIGFPYNYHDNQEIAFNPTAVPGDEDYACLFVCVGDGGSLVVTPRVPGNLGRIDSPLGAIHRIVPVLASATGKGFTSGDFTLSSNGQYHIPSGPGNSNPYASSSDPTPGDGFSVVREIYANGFRNPHRISWDPGGSHKMFCGNIGEVQCEEIELVEKGKNYGWPAREGSFRFISSDPTHVYPLNPSPDASGTYAYPVAQYDHATGFAVVGGFVYRGSAIPDLFGKYVCGDIVNGKLWIANEADMNLSQSTATGAAPAILEELGVKLGNTATSLLAILGTSRADLRFGTDHAGELYVLSKRNGRIYKVKQDNETVPAPVGGLAEWADFHENFEDGNSDNIVTSHIGSASLIVNDPIEGPSNRVLRFQHPGTSSSSYYNSIPIPEIPDGSDATLFFRFFVPDQNHDISFGLSQIADPSSPNDFRVQFLSQNQSGQLQVRNGGAIQNAIGIAAGTWYSVWAQIRNAAGSSGDRWNLSIQGGSQAVPTLVKTNISFRGGTQQSLKRFFIRSNTSGGSNISPIYIDDIRVDVGHANTTNPIRSDWRLVDHFEGPNPLASWQLPDAERQSSSIATDPDGNRYFRRKASSDASDNTRAIAARRLPFETPVSQTFTTFFRFRLEGGNLDHQFGASPLDPPDPSLYTPADLETDLRLLPMGTCELYDGGGGMERFIRASTEGQPLPPLETGIWYKVWLVANNSVWASGGQRWRAYLKGGIFPQPTPISEDLFFQNGAESTLTHFVSIASTGDGHSFGNDAIHLDDIHIHPGVNLTDPVASAWIPTSLARDGNQLTLTHATRLNRSFQLFKSDDLEAWTPLTESGEGDGNSWATDVAIIPPRQFFLTAEHPRRAFHPANWASDFAEGTVPAGVTLIRPATSAWSASPGKLTLTLTSEQAEPVVAGMVSRPGAYALVPGDWKNVDLRLTARTLRTASTSNRDVVVIFGYVDPTHFYYAHFGAASNGTTETVIMKVSGRQARVVIHSPLIVEPAPFTSLDPVNFRVTHSANGAISVYSEDMESPVMTANDTSHPVGRVGFGSFNDPAEFHQFSVSGEKR